MSIKQLFLAAALLAGTAVQAQAYTTFDNMTNGAGVGNTTAVNFLLFQSFSNAPFNSVMTDLTLSLFALGGDDGGSVVITLLPDDGGGIPDFGATPLLSSYLSDGAIASLVDGVYHLSTSIALDASQRYWVGVSDALDGDTYTVPSSVIWQTANDASGTGVAGELMVTDYTVWPVGSGFDGAGEDDGTLPPYLMQVSVVDDREGGSTDAPEPATIGILGLSLLGLGWARRRRATV